jgi:FkbM family methyltransferase
VAFDPLRKLFKDIGRYRQSRDKWRGRLRLGHVLGDPRPGLSERLARDWQGGYVPYGDDGLWLYIPADLDRQGRRLAIDGGVPDPVTALVARPGDVAIDIGGNLGEWMAPLAATVGREGRVYVFEPVPVLADALARTARINGFAATVEIVPSAVADATGKAAFNMTMAAGGDGALSGLSPGGGDTVPTVTLDDFTAERGLGRLDLVKIDVEGAERRVLEGAGKTLAALKPRLVFECGHESAEDRAAIAGLLDGAGYDLIGVLLDGVIVDCAWPAFRDPAGAFADGQTRNLLALPRG